MVSSAALAFAFLSAPAGFEGGGALDYAAFGRFGIALLLGLLVGLEREWAKAGDKPLFAGIRTFPLISLLGATAAMVSGEQGASWFLAATFFGFALLVATSHYVSGATPGHGTTTEITSLLVFMFGGLAFFGHVAIAAALTVLVTLVLSLKEPLHDVARRVEPQDIYATLKFAVVTIIVLPLIPDATLRFENEHLKVLEVLNPWRIWLLVVFVSGVAFVGYIASKVVGARRGIALTGLLGGIVSSTAVAASMAERSIEEERLAPQFALAVVLASTMMFPRTIIEVSFVNPKLGADLIVPLLAAGLFGFVASGYLWLSGSKAESDAVQLKNPFRLAPALKFGGLYAAMLVVSHYAAQRFATAGVFVAAAVGGLIDTRPISLSVADLALHGKLSSTNAVAAVMIASLMNTLLKGFIAAGAGAPRFRRLVLPAFILLVGGGVVATVVVAKYGGELLDIH
jgi:uncharacterized membrane protein (DUF4010 family)